MIGRVSPKLSRFLPTTSAIKKKSGGSPKGIVLSILPTQFISLST
jgi:hypothetical protein